MCPLSEGILVRTCVWCTISDVITKCGLKGVEGGLGESAFLGRANMIFQNLLVHLT